MQIERGSPLKGFGSNFFQKSLITNFFKKSLIKNDEPSFLKKA